MTFSAPDLGEAHGVGAVASPVPLLGDAEGDQGDVVARVASHDLRGLWPVEPLDTATWVLDDHRLRLRRLAVPHLSLSKW